MPCSKINQVINYLLIRTTQIIHYEDKAMPEPTSRRVGDTSTDIAMKMFGHCQSQARSGSRSGSMPADISEQLNTSADRGAGGSKRETAPAKFNPEKVGKNFDTSMFDFDKRDFDKSFTATGDDRGTSVPSRKRGRGSKPESTQGTAVDRGRPTNASAPGDVEEPPRKRGRGRSADAAMEPAPAEPEPPRRRSARLAGQSVEPVIKEEPLSQRPQRPAPPAASRRGRSQPVKSELEDDGRPKRLCSSKAARPISSLGGDVGVRQSLPPLAKGQTKPRSRQRQRQSAPAEDDSNNRPRGAAELRALSLQPAGSSRAERYAARESAKKKEEEARVDMLREIEAKRKADEEERKRLAQGELDAERLRMELAEEEERIRREREQDDIDDARIDEARRRQTVMSCAPTERVDIPDGRLTMQSIPPTVMDEPINARSSLSSHVTDGTEEDGSVAETQAEGRFSIFGALKSIGSGGISLVNAIRTGLSPMKKSKESIATVLDPPRQDSYNGSTSNQPDRERDAAVRGKRKRRVDPRPESIAATTGGLPDVAKPSLGPSDAPVFRHTVGHGALPMRQHSASPPQTAVRSSPTSLNTTNLQQLNSTMNTEVDLDMTAKDIDLSQRNDEASSSAAQSFQVPTRGGRNHVKKVGTPMPNKKKGGHKDRDEQEDLLAAKQPVSPIQRVQRGDKPAAQKHVRQQQQQPIRQEVPRKEVVEEKKVREVGEPEFSPVTIVGQDSGPGKRRHSNHLDEDVREVRQQEVRQPRYDTGRPTDVRMTIQGGAGAQVGVKVVSGVTPAKRKDPGLSQPSPMARPGHGKPVRKVVASKRQEEPVQQRQEVDRYPQSFQQDESLQVETGRRSSIGDMLNQSTTTITGGNFNPKDPTNREKMAKRMGFGDTPGKRDPMRVDTCAGAHRPPQARIAAPSGAGARGSSEEFIPDTQVEIPELGSAHTSPNNSPDQPSKSAGLLIGKMVMAKSKSDKDVRKAQADTEVQSQEPPQQSQQSPPEPPPMSQQVEMATQWETPKTIPPTPEPELPPGTFIFHIERFRARSLVFMQICHQNLTTSI